MSILVYDTKNLDEYLNLLGSIIYFFIKKLLSLLTNLSQFQWGLGYFWSFYAHNSFYKWVSFQKHRLIDTTRKNMWENLWHYLYKNSDIFVSWCVPILSSLEATFIILIMFKPLNNIVLPLPPFFPFCHKIHRMLIFISLPWLNDLPYFVCASFWLIVLIVWSGLHLLLRVN